jgi:hypothetical protein
MVHEFKLIEHLKVERLEKLEGGSILQVVFHSSTMRLK